LIYAFASKVSFRGPSQILDHLDDRVSENQAD
jgi:hypothetical protein